MHMGLCYVCDCESETVVVVWKFEEILCQCYGDLYVCVNVVFDELMTMRHLMFITRV